MGVLEFDGKPAVRSSSGKFPFHRRGDRRLLDALDALVMAYETAKVLEKIGIDSVVPDASSTTLWLGHVRENPTAGYPGQFL